MRLILLQVTVFSLFFLLLFALTFNMAWIEGLAGAIKDNSALSALISVVVLASDIVLPVPSSVVMLLNGKLFGIAGGTLISAAGLFLASLTGYYIGKRMTGRMNRLLSEKEQLRAESLFKRWGYVALIITRPVPLLSESLAIVAGLHAMSLRSFVLSSLAGCLPGAFIYAYYGSVSNSIQTQYLSFLLVLGIAVLAFLSSFLFKGKAQSI